MLFLDFEDSIAALEAELAELRHGGGGEDEVRLKARIDRQLETLYGRLTPWQTVQVARHPDRPCACEIIRAISHDFIELSGDRINGDDSLTTGGIARIMDHGVILIGHDRERTSPATSTETAPGLHKTTRLLRLANRFRLPVVIIADSAATTHDAGLSLQHALETALDLRVPLFSVLCGALSGPASALYLCADAILMLEHACLSAVTPEDAAHALWPEGMDTARALASAAESLNLTATTLTTRGVVDTVIPEPKG
ncbi:MAG: acetyl-CoA carboxylase carboxyl transferase subunit alpha, partial [Rhodospirillaceae bacterium]|nr:acetyl-CoA carboxylase carboxyl transferase subunit alpha [Rhodospirillaceae bacterium]